MEPKEGKKKKKKSKKSKTKGNIEDEVTENIEVGEPIEEALG